MPVTYDGVNLFIDFPSSVTLLDAQEDFYEPWKVFLNTPGNNGESNRGFPRTFRPIAGDDLVPGGAVKYSGLFFMQNQRGWRFRLPDEDISVTITGNLALEDPTIPAIVPRAGRTGLIFGLAEFVTASGITVAQDTKLTSIFSELDSIEGGFGHAELMRGATAILEGLLSGAPAGPIIFKGINGTTTRYEYTTDSSGNRLTIVTRNLAP